ncbi:MAG TPA: hypothetical protein VIV59_02910, partial [Anaeromyxobacteraceae bacterium]
EARMARLARAELPEVVARLRDQGIDVSRAEVRVAAPPAGPGGAAAADARGGAAPARGRAAPVGR